MDESSSSSSKQVYRLKRGTRVEDIQPSSSSHIPPLSEFDGPFQLAEYLSLKVRSDPHDIKGLVEVPGTSSKKRGVDEKHVWLYEHLRRIPIDLTPLITSLLSICTRETCPEMKANEWQYLCIAHDGKTEECCAIDYILHTIDSTVALLNSPQQFPSRLSIPAASLSYFPSLFRRLSRIFSHAFYHHREAFSLCEVETALYARFVALCETYEMVTDNLLYVPKSATKIHSGHEDDVDVDMNEKKGAEEEEEVDNEDEEDEEEEDEEEEESEEDESRGRDKEEMDNAGKRTRSLDRDRLSKNVDDIPPSRSPAVVSNKDTQSSPQASSSRTQGLANGSPNKSLPSRTGTMTPASDEKVSPSRDNVSQKVQQFEEGQGSPDQSFKSIRGTLSRGTNGRGKQPRGTMLWSSDSESAALPTVPEPGSDLIRTESNETAIHVGTSDESESVSTATSDEVPKDEIDLLEEQGKIPPVDSTLEAINLNDPTPSLEDTLKEALSDSVPTPELEKEDADKSVETAANEVEKLSLEDEDVPDPVNAVEATAPDISSSDAPPTSNGSTEEGTVTSMMPESPAQGRKANRKKGKGR
ncbi:Mob1/phocein [Kockovaella imperatae]|uniref:Mob1/phocein n=1 Tax=Kockovaella imperatae TaxID=4999 RepID=A0A1Y1UNX2_9TREE|nr:Mob1/phocein [Kockovaella imperatae]ORX38815.1 Mob1/phocein [Kockovaella imperatae]